MKHYSVIAHETFKEPGIYFYEGTWTIEELHVSTIKQVQECFSKNILLRN